jgi:hypothetical protein
MLTTRFVWAAGEWYRAFALELLGGARQVELDALRLVKLATCSPPPSRFSDVRALCVMCAVMWLCACTFCRTVPTSAPRTRSNGTFSMPTTVTLLALATSAAATSMPVMGPNRAPVSHQRAGGQSGQLYR